MLILNMALNFMFVYNLEKITSVIIQTGHLFLLSPKLGGCLIQFFLKKKGNHVVVAYKNMKMGYFPLQKKVLIFCFWPKHSGEQGDHPIILYKNNFQVVFCPSNQEN